MFSNFKFNQSVNLGEKELSLGKLSRLSSKGENRIVQNLIIVLKLFFVSTVTMLQQNKT